MGLDTYAAQLGEDGDWHVAPDEPFAGLHLCGGMYSGGEGSSSMRGKVYDEAVLEATGEGLYQELIEPATVAQMARALRAAVDAAKRAGPHVDSEGIPMLEVAGCDIAPGEAEDLARWFEVCAERGFAIQGWW